MLLYRNLRIWGKFLYKFGVHICNSHLSKVYFLTFWLLRQHPKWSPYTQASYGFPPPEPYSDEECPQVKDHNLQNHTCCNTLFKIRSLFPNFLPCFSSLKSNCKLFGDLCVCLLFVPILLCYSKKGQSYQTISVFQEA